MGLMFAITGAAYVHVPRFIYRLPAPAAKPYYCSQVGLSSSGSIYTKMGVLYTKMGYLQLLSASRKDPS